MDWFEEKCNEVLEDDYFIDAQFMARSRREALELVGDDSFYPGSDTLDDDEDDLIDDDDDDLGDSDDD